MSFNELNPPTSSLLISGDMRANFLATRRHMFSANLLQDPTFECWEVDDTTVPGTWQLGAGTVIRETAAIDRVVGPMSLRLTSAGPAATVFQYILDPASYDSYFDGRVFTGGCFVKSSTAGVARVRIFDGFSSTDSAFHTGGGTFEFLDVERLIDPAATSIAIELRVEAAGNAIFDGATCLFSDIKPDRFVHPVTIRRTLIHSRKGEIFVGTVDDFVPQRAFIVDQVQLYMPVVPVGADALADVLQYDGATFTSMFTGGGRPTILDGGSGHGGATPDGTYNRRCFVPKFDAIAPAAGQIIRSEIDQTGVATVGDDMYIHIRYRAFARPQELLAAAAMIN